MINKIINEVKRYYKIIVILAGAALIFSLVASVYLNRSAGNGGNNIDFVLKPGWGANVVISELYKKGIIKSRTAFKLVLAYKGKLKSLKKGVYSLNDGMTVGEVITVLTGNITKRIKVTIPEGFNNRQIGDLLVEKGFYKSRKEFLLYASKKSILLHFAIPAKNCEGYLFPDTYYFPVGYSKKKVIMHMINNFFNKISLLKKFPKNSRKRHSLIIMASIVEREAKVKNERPLIAGVFYNRLSKRYPLESCATVQYVFPKPKKRLFYIHLKIDSPYNTYRRRGLPPGPISNPGIESIKASLYPVKTDYMFFVLKGDGSHTFSKSFNTHVKAKKKYFGN